MPAFLTTSGLQKFAVATPEEPVTVKYMAVGSGAGAVSENIQSLFNEVYRTEIPNPLRDEDNPRNLEFTGYIPTTVGGWTITELGLYDDEGSLIAYHLLDESIVKSSPDSALKTDMYPTFVLALSNASDVELFVSTSREFAHEVLTGRDKSDSHPISAITGLVEEFNAVDLNINTKDAQNVKLTGNQSISGNKSFAGMLTSPDGKSNISLGNDGEITINSQSGTNTAQLFFSRGEGLFSVSGVKYRGDSSEMSAPTVIKPGVIRLAEDQEVTLGADVVAAVTPRQVNLSGFGSSTQKWYDVTSERAGGVNYTNTAGRAMQVIVSATSSGFRVFVSGVQLPLGSLSNTLFTIPDRATYRIEGRDVDFVEVLAWWEFR